MKRSVFTTIMSHLSDISKCEVLTLRQFEQIKFVKSLLMAYKDTTVEIDPYYEWFARVAVPTDSDVIKIIACKLNGLGLSSVGKAIIKFLSEPIDNVDLSKLSADNRACMQVYHTMHKTI